MRASLAAMSCAGALWAGCGSSSSDDTGDDTAGDDTASDDVGNDASGGAPCKRGIAANTAPGDAFSPAVGWWYDWAIEPSAATPGIEFAPMTWGANDVTRVLPADAAFLLGFNEPNFHAQSNLTAEAAAALWPQVEAQAAVTGAAIVSSAMNFCGPAENCNGTSPYDYLRDFFAACDGCRVDHVAVHWYNCDLPSLRDYLEPGDALEGFEQFLRPTWLTEFSCGGDASVAEQEAFMREAVPYLETSPHVFRYAWFSAGPIPNARLVDDDGTPTALGEVYAELAGDCR